MKILIVEDENELRSLVKRYLEKNNFIVDEAGDGRKALDMLDDIEYDCVILDLNLPEVDGIEVTKQLRKNKNNVPIIMLTARSQIYNKLEGFDSGADDYITKPFDMKELVARVNAVLKRRLNGNEKIYYCEYEVLTRMNTLKKGNKEIELSNKEMGILEYLIINKDKIVSTEELLAHVWDTEIDMFTDTVKTHIKTLRQKIDPQKEHIMNVRGKGYLYKE